MGNSPPSISTTWHSNVSVPVPSRLCRIAYSRTPWWTSPLQRTGCKGGRSSPVISRLTFSSECRRLRLRPRPPSWLSLICPCRRTSRPCYAPNTLQDLSQALSRLPRGKHPGSDGLPCEFYQALWPLLGSILLAVFMEAFDSAAGSLTPTQLLGTRHHHVVLQGNGSTL